MPTDHARKKFVRQIQRLHDLTYTDAARIERDPRAEELCELLASGLAETYDESDAFLNDPKNERLCGVCGWTVGMICPECPGCGCYNHVCSGWRHREFDHEDDEGTDPFAGCAECGGGPSGPYDYEECFCEFV